MDEDEDAIRTGPLGLNQLNSPTEPLVELIFVHGLGGGSRKSWSKTKSEDHFWPRSWLPRDPDFHNVRIHSFGYKSSKSEIVATISGIPDIAQSLLSAIRDSSAIRHSQNGIILVGHSMGGLVIKKVRRTLNPVGHANTCRHSYKHMSQRHIRTSRLVYEAYISSARHTMDQILRRRFKASSRKCLSFGRLRTLPTWIHLRD